MKILQTVQKYFATIGYDANRYPLNSDTVGEIFQRILAIICQFLYLIRHANSPKDIVDNIFMTAVAILCFISVMSTIQKMKMIFIFINEIEQIVNESEFNVYSV